MADGFDAQANMFMMQNMRSGGASSGSGGGAVSFLGGMQAPSHEGMQKKVQAVAPGSTLFKLIAESIQGGMQAMSFESLGILGPSMQLPAGFSLDKKIAGIIASKGPGK
jgi:hypothetical protein